MPLVLNTPGIYAKGAYEIRAPYDALLSDWSNCTCIAIKSFGELLPEVDPFIQYYEPVGLEDSDYQEAIASGVSMVTLVDPSGVEAVVPDSHIISFPFADGVPYSRKILSIDLGLIPDEESIAPIVNELEQMASTLVGISATARVHRLPLEGLVSWAQHRTNETNRAASRSGNETIFEQKKRLEEQVAAMAAYIDELTQ